MDLRRSIARPGFNDFAVLYSFDMASPAVDDLSGLDRIGPDRIDCGGSPRLPGAGRQTKTVQVTCI